MSLLQYAGFELIFLSGCPIPGVHRQEPDTKKICFYSLRKELKEEYTGGYFRPMTVGHFHSVGFGILPDRRLQVIRVQLQQQDDVCLETTMLVILPSGEQS